MSTLVAQIANLVFSGVPSSAVYDGVKKVWQKVTQREWDDLFLDTFEQVVQEEQPYLAQFTQSDGVVEIDRVALARNLHQDLGEDIDDLSYSQLTSNDKIAVLVQAMVKRNTLILGGHTLTVEGYTHLVQELVQEVKEKFKAVILANPEIYQQVLLDETLANREVLEQVNHYLNQQFNLLQSEIKTVQRQLEVLPNIITSHVLTESHTALTSEHQAELDYVRDLIKNNNPQQALELLTSFEQRNWHTTRNIVKYRLIANMGAAKLSLGKGQEAAKDFIRALQFNRDDTNALYHAALGHSLLGQIEQAKAYLDRVLAQDPTHERAYSVLVQLSPDMDLDSLIEMVPEAYRNSVDVAYALGYLARNKQDFTQAEQWFQTALDNDAQNIFDIKAAMASLILEQISTEPLTLQTQQLEDADRTRIETAIQLLTDAWAQIAGTDFRSLHPEILMNRGMANAMLDCLDLAIADLDLALQIAPNNSTFKKNRALLARDMGDHFRAIQMLESLVDVPQIPDAEIALAEVLRETKAFNRATEVIQRFLAKNPSLPFKEQAQRVLVQIHIETKNIQATLELYNTIQDKDSKTISDLINSAQIAHALGRDEDALQSLEQAQQKLEKEDLRLSQSVLDLARVCYSMQQYDMAASLYEKCTNPTLNTRLNHRLIDCYYRAGQFHSALMICQSLRQKYGGSRFICEVEFAIHEHIGDLNEAKRICQVHLSQCPDDLYMQLHLASVNYRLRCFQELDAFLISSTDISQLSLEMSLHLVNLYAFRGLFQKFLEALYQIRQRFFNNSQAHVAYAIQFFEYDQHPSIVDLLAHTVVEKDVAVCLEDEAGQTSWHVLVDKSVSDVHHKEINLSDSFALKLLNKQVGEEVILRETSFSKDIRKIIQIVSKYVYALWESLELVDQRFPDSTGLWTVKVDPAEFETGMPQSIAAVVNSGTETLQHTEDLYKHNGIPLGTFAKIIQRDVLTVRSGLISNPELGIRCCRGDQEERSRAISLLSSRPGKLIVDITTLLTLHDLDAADVVMQAFGRLGIAQSTIDLLQGVIEQHKARQTKDSASISKNGEHFVIQEVSSESIQQYTKHLQNIQDWIEKNCDVLPCTAALDLAPGAKQELEKLIGLSFTETILIASEPGHFLYSDDWALRQVAKAKFGIEGVWTQVVLMQCQAQAVIDRPDYSQMVIRLVALNHHYTSIDAAVLIEAARQADWFLKLPLTPLLKFLETDHPNRTHSR